MGSVRTQAPALALKSAILQGDKVREYVADVPRVEPTPMIHVYVDLHLSVLHKSGFLDTNKEDAVPIPEDQVSILYKRLVS